MPIFPWNKKKQAAEDPKKKTSPAPTPAPKNEGDFAKQLQQKDVGSWSVNEVGIWLDLVGLGEYKASFISNGVSGSELLELTAEDLDGLKMTKLGHRKKIQKLIGALQKSSNIANFLETLSQSSEGDSSNKQLPREDLNLDTLSEGGNSSGVPQSMHGTEDDILFKTYYKDEVHLFSFKRDKASFNELKLKVMEEFNTLTPIIRYKDSDGDMIKIKKEGDFNLCIQSAPEGQSIKLYISLNENELSNSSSPATPLKAAPAPVSGKLDNFDEPIDNSQLLEESELDDSVIILDDLVDSVCVINDESKMIYVNKALEKMFGYSKKDLIGYNVRKLMPNPHRAKHDAYVQSYLTTGVAKLIGKGRTVEARTKDGAVFPIFLSVAEGAFNGKHAFIGTMNDLRKKNMNNTSNASKYNTIHSLLDNLVDACIIMTDDNIVRFFNRAAEKLFGYERDEVIGKTVNILMPDKYSKNHDEYVNNYQKTGKAKIIGIGRRVEALTKQNQVIPIWLSVAETRYPGFSRAYTATIQDLRNTK